MTPCSDAAVSCTRSPSLPCLSQPLDADDTPLSTVTAGQAITLADCPMGQCCVADKFNFEARVHVTLEASHRNLLTYHYTALRQCSNTSPHNGVFVIVLHDRIKYCGDLMLVINKGNVFYGVLQCICSVLLHAHN